MLRSLYAGISGMKVNQVKLDVIGNNIANVGTTAFKGSRVRFQDMVSQSMTQALGAGANQGGVNAKQVGLGVQVGGIDTLVSQGMMQPTSRNLDVAMDGEGYLILGKGLKPTSNDTSVLLKDDYTVDTTNGMSLSFTRDGALTLDSEGNLLNSDGLRVMGYAISDDATTSLVYEDGESPVLSYVDADSQALTTGNQLVPLMIPEKVVDPDNPDQTIRIRTFSIEKNGVIKAVLENGKVAALGQIAVASFKNPAGLARSGGNTVTSTANSGEAVVRTGTITGPDAADAYDNSKGYGDMLQGMLEMSNVDLAEQFTDMIITSRAFQAAGKMITTGDEILQDIINLKR